MSLKSRQRVTARNLNRWDRAAEVGQEMEKRREMGQYFFPALPNSLTFSTFLVSF